MRKIVLSLFALSILAACGGGDTGSGTNPVAVPETPTDPAYQKGLELVAKSDCLTCHKIEEKLTGPSYKEVAEKYKGATPEKITELAQKIIKGGTGNWGTVIMIPHPSVTQEDAEAMVKYILLLK
ncbi:MAG: c-type cytochrome [Sphingobacteriales bacterium]|nr:c-type cytochrome [Sphingobacteriales bacterium]